MDSIELAQRIQRRHTPVGEPGWQCCKACGQASGGMERFSVWPCDARALADAVAGALPEPPDPGPIVRLHRPSPFPDWDRGPFVAELPLSEAKKRAEAEGLVIFEQPL